MRLRVAAEGERPAIALTEPRPTCSISAFPISSPTKRAARPIPGCARRCAPGAANCCMPGPSCSTSGITMGAHRHGAATSRASCGARPGSIGHWPIISAALLSGGAQVRATSPIWTRSSPRSGPAAGRRSRRICRHPGSDAGRGGPRRSVIPGAGRSRAGRPRAGPERPHRSGLRDHPRRLRQRLLDAVDTFTRFANSRLIGAPTSADSTYMEVRTRGSAIGRRQHRHSLNKL